MGKPIKCEYCDYTNKDIRNVTAHTRVHTDVQSFVCAKCGKKFEWGNQIKAPCRLWQVPRLITCHKFSLLPTF